MPVVMLRKGVYRLENQKIRQEYQHQFKANHSWPWTVPLTVSPCLRVAFRVGWLFLQLGHTDAIMCNYGVVHQQMHKKSTLEISCNYRQSSYLGHVSDTSRETKEHIRQPLSKNKIKY